VRVGDESRRHVVRCEKASQLDPAAYLAEPEDPRWAEFRSHFPVCPDCSREVAGWNRIEQGLRAQGEPAPIAHPNNALLASLQEPGALSPDQRSQIESHLAGCRMCSDKLVALREFDFAAIAEVAPPSPLRMLGGFVRSVGERLRRLLTGPTPEGAEAFEELIPWRQPELVFQARRGTRGGSQTVGSASPERGTPQGLLAVVEGDLAGQVYSVFTGQNRIGRSRDCEVRISSDALARVEAELTASSGRFEISSAHGRGALRINGESVGAAELRDGDLVEIGDQRLRFRTIGPKNAPRDDSSRLLEP
jgi:hypothetical protein